MKGLDNLHEDEQSTSRGVSPVIGVILMVAITVILAAVIATFVLGLGEQVSDTTPTNSWSADDFGSSENITDGERVVEFRHTGGDSVDIGNLDISLAFNTSDDGITDVTGFDEDDLEEAINLEHTSSDDSISAGDTVYLEFDSGEFEEESHSDATVRNLVDAGETATLVWESDGSSSTLNSHTISDAITVSEDNS